MPKLWYGDSREDILTWQRNPFFIRRICWKGFLFNFYQKSIKKLSFCFKVFWALYLIEIICFLSAIWIQAVSRTSAFVFSERTERMAFSILNHLWLSFMHSSTKKYRAEVKASKKFRLHNSFEFCTLFVCALLFVWGFAWLSPGCSQNPAAVKI